jgi:hypothetical protein
MTEEAKHDALPVSGYTQQSATNVQLVNEHKQLEEDLLQRLEMLATHVNDFDKRWIAIAKTHIEQGFMAMNRAVFKPKRIGQ